MKRRENACTDSHAMVRKEQDVRVKEKRKRRTEKVKKKRNWREEERKVKKRGK